MRKKVFLSLAAAPLAVAGIATCASLQSKKDSYAYEDELKAISEVHNYSVEETRDAFDTQSLITKIDSPEKLDDLGLDNYRNLIGDYYLVSFDSPEETVEGYNILDEASDGVVLNKKLNSYAGYGLGSIADIASYTWWGTDAVGIDDFETGDNHVSVGIIDTGFNIDHDIFENRSRLRLSLSDTFDLNRGGYRVNEEHGTAVAGVIAQATPSNVDIVPITGNGYSSSVIEGLADLYESDVRIVNISVGWDKPTGNDLAYYENIFEEFKNSGMIIVGAAGNYNLEEDPGKTDKVLAYPASSDYVITVGATAQDGSSYKLANFSKEGSDIDFVAPGANVLTAYPNLDNSICFNNCYFWGNGGTSFASPLVAAAIADIFTVKDDYTYDGVYQYLADNALDLGTTGKDIYFGHGQIALNENTVTNYYQHYEVDASRVSIALGDPFDNNQSINATGNSLANTDLVAWKLVRGNDTTNVPNRFYKIENPAPQVTFTLDISEAGDYTVWFVDSYGAVNARTFNSIGRQSIPPTIVSASARQTSCENGELCTATITVNATANEGTITSINYYAGNDPDSLTLLQGNTFTGYGGDKKYWAVVVTDSNNHSSTSEVQVLTFRNTTSSTSDGGEKTQNTTLGTTSEDDGNSSGGASSKSAKNPNTGGKASVALPAVGIFAAISFLALSKKFRR